MKSIPVTKQVAIERVIKMLLKDAYTIPKLQVPGVNNPDYAEAFGMMRGFLIAIYGKFDQSMTICLANEERHITANDWFREMKESIQREVGLA